jgi:hypothetical protein
MAKQIAFKEEIINGQKVLVKVFAPCLAKLPPQAKTYKERIKPKAIVIKEEETVDYSVLPADLLKKLGYED